CPTPNEDNDDDPLAGHVLHCVRCLDGLPASLVEMDASRMAIGFIAWERSTLLNLRNER
ncbi:hypothetical protein BGW80DRAFT_1327332, partial [Lactifluus volemus]